MKVTLLGTGSPVPLLGRAGTAIHVDVGGDELLIDCGPRTVTELLRNDINPGHIEDLYFTHQHMDHNASFFHFAISGWTVGGRESLTIYGPSGTESLLDALYDVYEEDIAYRKHVGYPSEGIDDIEWEQTTAEFEVETDEYRITALPVKHSIETYAYRIDEKTTDTSFVFSGDTRELSALASFAADADVLVHDCCIGPVDESIDPAEFEWDAYTKPLDEGKRERLSAVHSDPTEVGEIAAEAEVDTVVLTHLLPYRDTEAMRESAQAVFDGTVKVAEDGMALQTG